MKTRLLSLFAIVFAFTLVFSGCSQAQPSQNEVASPRQDEIPVAAISPEDYEGTWLRTGTYIDGALEHTVPATLILFKDSYTSTGTCEVAGDVMHEGDNTITMTITSVNCPGVTAGGSVTYNYKIEYDEERDIEVMTITVANIMETYDRQS